MLNVQLSLLGIQLCRSATSARRTKELGSSACTADSSTALDLSYPTCTIPFFFFKVVDAILNSVTPVKSHRSMLPIFPPDTKATRILLNESDYFDKLYVLLDSSRLVSYKVATNDFDTIATLRCCCSDDWQILYQQHVLCLFRWIMPIPLAPPFS